MPSLILYIWSSSTLCSSPKPREASFILCTQCYILRVLSLLSSLAYAWSLPILQTLAQKPTSQRLSRWLYPKLPTLPLPSPVLLSLNADQHLKKHSDVCVLFSFYSFPHRLKSPGGIYSLLPPQDLEKYLSNRRCSINLCWMNAPFCVCVTIFWNWEHLELYICLSEFGLLEKDTIDQVA